MPYSIMLDSGHGGSDPGAVYNGREEKTDARKLMLAVGEILKANDIDVRYTQTSDTYLSPLERARKANLAHVDLFLSIHRNSFPAANEAQGVESLVYDLSGLKYTIAQAIDEELAAIGFDNLGVKARPDLIVLRRTTMPAILVEIGFINSDNDNRLFDDNFKDIARAIASGVLNTLDEYGGLPAPAPVKYRIQTGLFLNENNARRLKEELIGQDFPASMDQWKAYYRILIGSYATLDEAVRMERRLKIAGYDTLIMTLK